MPNYKIGDKVQLRQDLELYRDYDGCKFIPFMVGITEITIKSLHQDDQGFFYRCEEISHAFTDEMLESKFYRGQFSP